MGLVSDMDIERLKELKQQIKGVHDGINGDDLNLLYDLLPLVDAAIARQSVKSEEVAEAIQTLEDIYPSQKQIATGEYPHVAEAIDLAITALQAYQPKPDCESAEKLGDKCCGYGKSEYDDEPIDACKQCEKQASYEED